LESSGSLKRPEFVVALDETRYNFTGVALVASPCENLIVYSLYIRYHSFLTIGPRLRSACVHRVADR
jgi:hypothetical protein